MKTKRHLSQNFLYDPSILKRIIQISGINEQSTVVEIGPGPGRMTRLMSERAKRVIAIEIDHELYENLTSELIDCKNVELVRADAMKFPFGLIEGPFKVVANIPYHITTPLIFRLIECRPLIQSMTITVQKEVAERAVASPGGKDYGVLSISLQYYGRVGLKFIIPRGAFRPAPRVDSACLHIDLTRGPGVAVDDEKMFFEIVKTAFSTRRKTLHNALKKFSPAMDDLLKSAGIDPIQRAETLSLEDFARLSNITGRFLRQ